MTSGIRTLGCIVHRIGPFDFARGIFVIQRNVRSHQQEAQGEFAADVHFRLIMLEVDVVVGFVNNQFVVDEFKYLVYMSALLKCHRFV